MSDQRIDAYPTADNWKDFYERQTKLLRQSPIPDNEILDSLTLYTSLSAMRRFLFWDTMYQRILNLQGDLFVFGVRWGRDLAALLNLRAIYEPMNFSRRIVGFDTFSGFVDVHDKDGTAEVVEPGAYSTTENYEAYLGELLRQREALLPYGHISRTLIIKGDARETVPQYLEKRSQTIAAFCYFDMDLYEPTLDVANAIKPFLNSGAIIGCDQLAHPTFPGETHAIREVFGRTLKIERRPVGPGQPSFFEYDP